VTTQGVGWASKEASDLVAPPLNPVLYMHLRIFAYTSNVLIASFEYMDLNPEGDVLVLGCILGPDEVSFADVGHPFVFRNTKGPGRVTHDQFRVVGAHTFLFPSHFM